ncbi:HORMA domain-containing protein 1 [Araneus ventricosus]|uniref:HORMA domain-containing protein 1 n=1 Tax=Araneus ventricosus TaxID=182803 RepID=A0A4Y2BEG0_ARAVE|nr:HORMA domain-containing protein 1 [Araneus ventricosus]
MAVSTMTVQEGTMQEWKTLFPEFATLEGSCMFIKKLIAVSLSSITYIRGIFPEKAYGERTLGGLRVKLLTEDCGIKAVTKFIDAIRSCYDAVEKKYLQQLSIGICTNRENYNEVIEAYNLVFKYKDDECSVTCNNKMKTFSPKLSDPTVKATFLMLKNITAVSNILKKLPESVYLSLKLLYYDEVTPENYEPPGFEASLEPKFSFPQKTMNISLGKIDTDRQGYKFLLKTTYNKQNDAEDPLKSTDPDKKAPFINADEQTVIKLSRLPEKEKLCEETKMSASMKCPCKCKLVEEHDVIACTNCKQLQHKTCYGFLKPNENPSIFYCVDCATYEDYPLADVIYTHQGKECQEFCLTRRAVSLCLNQNYFTKLNLEKLLGCSKTMANTVIKKLVAQDFIELQINTDKYSLNKSNIDFALQKYFPSTENEELMDEDPKLETNSLPLSTSLLTPNKGPSLPLDDVTMIESSVKKVRDLNLHDRSPAKSSTSQKRKASSEIVNLDDSVDIFQSQKRLRARRVVKKNKF